MKFHNTEWGGWDAAYINAGTMIATAIRALEAAQLPQGGKDTPSPFEFQ
jgi:hypothetical protein